MALAPLTELCSEIGDEFMLACSHYTRDEARKWAAGEWGWSQEWIRGTRCRKRWMRPANEDDPGGWCDEMYYFCDESEAEAQPFWHVTIPEGWIW